MKWIVVIVALLVLATAALSVRASRQRREAEGAERPHRLYDSTSRRQPPTEGDEP